MTCSRAFRWGLVVSTVTAVASALPRVGLAEGPGETIKNSIGMELVLIPAGEFEMGSPEKPQELLDWAKQVAPNFKWQLKHFDPETPQHRVRITKPYYMGVCEVTRNQFDKFVAETNYKTDAEKDGKGGYGFSHTYDPKKKTEQRIGFFQKPKYTWRGWGSNQGGDDPVVNVSWNDAVAFCEWLSHKEHKAYRLPTEAEWEYACRAGTTTRYYNGDDPEGLVRVGNVRDRATHEKFNWWKDSLASSDGFALTAPVGHFKPNAFGLYDMHGNAAEWCADRFGVDYYQHSPSENPKGADSGSARVSRGGSWGLDLVFCRSASRDWGEPTCRNVFIGFRVVAER